MSTFEHQSADAIRALAVACVVLGVGLVIAIGVAVWGFVNASAANDAVKAGLVQQTANRTSNVAAWCNAIDQLDGTLTAYVAQVPGAPQLNLKPLDCKTLERNTLASTK